MDKAQARNKFLAARNLMKKDAAEAASEIIAKKFLREFSHFNSFLCYMSIGSEVCTKMLIKTLYAMNKAVYLPKIAGNDMELGLYKGEDSLVRGAYGILEPAVCDRPVYIDAAAVPGVVFDKTCARAGYGKGYYDRLLKKRGIGTKAGLAFECQLTEKLETEPQDIPMDLLITEKYIYRRNS